MNRLQQLREAAGLSYADLSRRSDVSQDVIRQFEAGEDVSGAEAVIPIPGETTVEDRPVLLYKLADALNATLIDKGVLVTPEELLQPATENLPASADAFADPSEVTQPAIPLIGVNFPSAEDLPAEARSHNPAEQPDDIDAALEQLAKNSEVMASEEAARTQPVPVELETAPTGPEITPASDLPAGKPVAEMSGPMSDREIMRNVLRPEITDGVPAPGPETYEPVPEPEMPGPAPAPETMKPDNGDLPEPPTSTANLGMTTGDELGEIIPAPPALPKIPVAVPPIEAETPVRPVQDDAPLTTPVADKMPTMQPYIKPQPTEAEKSRYKLPMGTVVPSIIGVTVALVWYAWRSWRRSKTDSERVAPYYREK